jgi:DNA-binding NarL/FixJ family response regulator
MRILIADDSEPVRRAVRRLLSMETGWDVCGEASDGQDALQKTRELHPDLVLLDIHMPVASGFETARLIRKENSQIKILIMTQGDTEQNLPSSLRAGADGCIDKARVATDLVPSIKNLQPAKISPPAPN